MFKNIMIYQIGKEWPTSSAQLQDALQEEVFTPIKATEQKSIGWTSPRGIAHGALVENIAGQYIARMCIETKSVPAQIIKQYVAEQAEKITQETGRTVSKKERQNMKDDALQALLPRAFSKKSFITMWIDPQKRRLIIDAGAGAKADELITSLSKVAAGKLQINLWHTQKTPQNLMSNWLASEPEEMPAEFEIERDCELKASGEKPAIIKFTRHHLQTPQIQEHIKEGKLPTKLALNWQQKISFTLTQDLQIKKISLIDAGEEKAPVSQDEKFDADITLITGEISGLIDALASQLHTTE